MAGAEELVSASGKPLLPEPKLVVIKVPKDHHIPQQLAQAISHATGCNVIELPMSSDLMMGRLAAQDMESIHTAIHVISGIPPIDFTIEELKEIYSDIQFVQDRERKLHDIEVAILKRIKPFLQATNGK